MAALAAGVAEAADGVGGIGIQAHDARLLAHVRLTPPQSEQDGGELATVVGLILLDGEGLADVERRVVTEESDRSSAEEDTGAGGGTPLAPR